MAIFNNKEKGEIPQQDLEELFQRLENLERKCRRMDARIAELEEKVINDSTDQQSNDSTDQQLNNSTDQQPNQWHGSVVSFSFGDSEEAAEQEADDDSSDGSMTIISTISAPSDQQRNKSTNQQINKSTNQQLNNSTEDQTLLYLPAPNPDGTFPQATWHEQIGKSIYQLTTKDGRSGSFILLDTPDAIATAMLSVSTFVKPACKVIGNTAQFPRHIVTEEEGTAIRDGLTWRVIRKAVVKFK